MPTVPPWLKDHARAASHWVGEAHAQSPTLQRLREVGVVFFFPILVVIAVTRIVTHDIDFTVWGIRITQFTCTYLVVSGLVLGMPWWLWYQKTKAAWARRRQQTRDPPCNLAWLIVSTALCLSVSVVGLWSSATLQIMLWAGGTGLFIAFVNRFIFLGR